MLKSISCLVTMVVLTTCINQFVYAREAPSHIELAVGDVSIVIRPQTADEAYWYLSNTLNQMSFFEENNYDVALPVNPAFRTPGRMASPEEFRRQVYRESDFTAAMNVLHQRFSDLEKTLTWFDQVEASSDFHVPDSYSVVLTLYGPGGSYDAANGTITLLTSADGTFKGGGGVETIAHEMMHIAVEDELVQRFHLSHWEKERLVDLLCLKELGGILPELRLQSQGVDALDRVVEETPLVVLGEALHLYKEGKRQAD